MLKKVFCLVCQSEALIDLPTLPSSRTLNCPACGVLAAAVLVYNPVGPRFSSIAKGRDTAQDALIPALQPGVLADWIAANDPLTRLPYGPTVFDERVPEVDDLLGRLAPYPPDEYFV